MPKRRINWRLVIFLYGMGVPRREVAKRAGCSWGAVHYIWAHREMELGDA